MPWMNTNKAEALVWLIALCIVNSCLFTSYAAPLLRRSLRAGGWRLSVIVVPAFLIPIGTALILLAFDMVSAFASEVFWTQRQYQRLATAINTSAVFLIASILATKSFRRLFSDPIIPCAMFAGAIVAACVSAPFEVVRSFDVPSPGSCIRWTNAMPGVGPWVGSTAWHFIVALSMSCWVRYGYPVHAIRNEFCSNCGYDLVGLSGEICPECGARNFPRHRPSHIAAGDDS